MLKNQKRSGFVRCIAILAAAVLSLVSGITVLAEDVREEDLNCGSAFTSDFEAGQAVALEATPAVAAAETAAVQEEKRVQVFIDDAPYTGMVFSENDTTYVGIREFSLFMGAHSVDWDGASKTAVITADNLAITAQDGSRYITANGRCLWAPDGIRTQDGTMYVPLRVIAKAFDCSVFWSDTDYAAYLTSGSGAIAPANEFYGEDALLWLSRVIHAEAGLEPMEGKLAVGSVVLNRVNSSQFPNTIYSVIFDMSAGVQFSPAASGTIYCTPNEESVLAAKLCLDGASISDNVFFFVNEAIAENTWVSDNRPYVMTIGNHTFFA